MKSLTLLEKHSTLTSTVGHCIHQKSRLDEREQELKMRSVWPRKFPLRRTAEQSDVTAVHVSFSTARYDRALHFGLQFLRSLMSTPWAGTKSVRALHVTASPLSGDNAWPCGWVEWDALAEPRARVSPLVWTVMDKLRTRRLCALPERMNGKSSQGPWDSSAQWFRMSLGVHLVPLSTFYTVHNCASYDEWCTNHHRIHSRGVGLSTSSIEWTNRSSSHSDPRLSLAQWSPTY